ncbi:Uncharacterized protein TCM_013843 [Theobroma cacao]|uniref:Uncharacterized protein n=1 Tax=Theobroma cacao TaxID=3641 RepID=A0A061FY05_THECC|nr:Uncharacterized protein TCM_013843 [Theobroma cacao]
MESIINCSGVASGKGVLHTSQTLLSFYLSLNFSHVNLKSIPIKYHAIFILVGKILDKHFVKREEENMIIKIQKKAAE